MTSTPEPTALPPTPAAPRPHTPTSTSTPTPTPEPAPTETPEPTATPARSSSPAARSGSGNATAGRPLYEQHCATCHGQGGEGFIGDRLVGLRLSLLEVTQLLRQPRAMMASFSPEQLSDRQITDIYAYLRTLDGG